MREVYLVLSFAARLCVYCKDSVYLSELRSTVHVSSSVLSSYGL